MGTEICTICNTEYKTNKGGISVIEMASLGPINDEDGETINRIGR